MQRVRIPSPAGLLDGLLELPPGYAGVAGAVLAHPHPLHGGTMRNKVVVRVAHGLLEAGAAVLRFNFRGVEGARAFTTAATASGMTCWPRSGILTARPRRGCGCWRDSPSAHGCRRAWR